MVGWARHTHIPLKFTTKMNSALPLDHLGESRWDGLTHLLEGTTKAEKKHKRLNDGFMMHQRLRRASRRYRMWGEAVVEYYYCLEGFFKGKAAHNSMHDLQMVCP